MTLDFLTFCRISRYVDRFELEFAVAAGYGGTGTSAGFWREMALEAANDGGDYGAWYRPLFETAYGALNGNDVSEFARVDAACRATARAALSVVYPVV